MDKEVYAINDAVMAEEMVGDLVDIYEYSEEEAMVWVANHGSDLISEMWGAYSSYMENNAEIKGVEDDT